MQDENAQNGTQADAPFAEFNYGLLPSVQFSFSMPFSFMNGPGEVSHWSAGDFEVGLKYRFLQETDSRPQVAFYPSIEMPTGNGDYTKLLLPIWAQKTTGRTSVFGGGGWERNPGFGNRNFWSGGIAVTRQFSKVINAGFEMYGNTTEAAIGKGSVSAGVGINDDFSDVHSVVLSVGTSVLGQRGLHVYGAYEFRLGSEAGK
ncbi:MAG: hypothetical protein JOZ77_08255 [Candidatus Eremiobacteraeota bacterium]|nr:hypothetical protein [Candidatus Eremiobacteraeota bacterium]